MLKLIEGGFYSGAHEEIVARIGKAVASGERAMLIVPEQQTVSAESEMIDILPTASALHFEVTNFTRFANTVFRTVGGIAKEHASSAKSALIMWRAITELRPMLTTVGKEVSTGTVSRMLAAVKQISSCAVTSEALFAAADSLSSAREADEDTRLISKIRDIASIMALYKSLLKERFSDGDEDLIIAAGKLSEMGEFMRGVKVFIDGFTSFTEPQYQLLEVLLSVTDVTVSITLPKAAQDAFEYTETRETHARLARLAARADVEVSALRTDSTQTAPNPFAADLISLLFRSTGATHPDFLPYSDFVRIFEAETPYEECDFVAQDIKRRVMEGAKYSDFGIIARSLEGYDGILNVAFDKAGIPLFSSTRSDIESYEAVKLIYSALAAVSGGYSRRDVITYAKCSLSGAERDLVDELELYAERWQISGSRFTDGIFWNMNPDGFTERRSDTHAEKLKRIDTARGQIIDPLMSLEAAVAEAKTVRDFCRAVFEFMRTLSVEEQLRKRSMGKDVVSNDLERVYKLICDSLDTLSDVLGDTECTKETFLSLLKITFAEANIGRIPAYAEQVTAGNADTVRLGGKKYVYVIGASSGVLPARIDDDSYFTEKDKRTISAHGLTVAQDTDVRSSRELYYILRAISYAKEGVIVTYSSLDTAFKPQAPSDIIKRMAEISHGSIRPTRLALLPSSERIYTEEYALEHLCSSDPDADAIRAALVESGAGDRLRVSDGEIRNVGLRLGRTSTDSLYGQTIPMTQGRIDKFVSCPMSYFCKFNLGLSDNRLAEFGSDNIGTFIHAIIEGFFKELRARGKAVSELTREDREALVKGIAEDHARRFFENVSSTSARIRHTVNRLCRTALPIVDGLCDEFADCKYEPTFFELRIDKNENGLPSPAIFETESGRKLYIYGTMDRLDTFKKGDDVYVRVIDYKTGTKIFDVRDIERGENLQMFLYLKSVVETESGGFARSIGLREGGGMIPAGVIYVKTSIADVTIDHDSAEKAESTFKATQTRLGMLLDDPDSLAAMNRKYIPVSFKANGEPDSRSAKKLYSLDGWEQMNRTIEKVVCSVADRMTDGDIDASPLKKGGKSSACKWCEFKPICRNANV